MHKGEVTMGGRCFFIGHRDAPMGVARSLKQTIEDAITQQEIDYFIVGHYGNFDRMAAASVIELKARYPEIKLFLLLPYHPAERCVDTPAGFDRTYYPEGQEFIPDKLAILKANQAMIKNCDLLITYSPYPGNARKLAMHAAQRGVLVRQVIEDCSCSQRRTDGQIMRDSK